MTSLLAEVESSMTMASVDENTRVQGTVIKLLEGGRGYSIMASLPQPKLMLKLTQKPCHGDGSQRQESSWPKQIGHY